VWQALHEELADQGFTVVAVSFDTRAPEASRPWIEQAAPTYPCLLDPHHRVAELYDMVNVPQAVWIDEEGRIVRPTETAGTGDEFRAMGRPGGLAADDLSRLRARRAEYLDAIRDWVANGAASRFVTSPSSGPEEGDRARRRASGVEDALAFAHFGFGTWLARAGRADEAAGHLAEARRLRPASWAFRRQSWELEEQGKAGGPEFWAAVEALGDRHYYEPPDLPGPDAG
jgi:hypothetical protein